MRFSKATLLKVIVFSIVCLIFTVVLGVRLANVPLFRGRTTYEAEFENAAGVIKGDSVKIAGVNVGRVETARIEAGKAIVEFSVDDSVKLTDETEAAIRWRNVLGQRFLYLYPNDGGRPLEEGDRIPLAQTTKAGDIGELLNSLGPILRSIDPEKANAFLDSMNTALAGNEVAVRQLIDNSAVLARELAAMDTQIASAVDSSDEILAVFADQNDALGQIFDDLNTVGGALHRTTGELNSVISDFAVVQKHLDNLLAENSTNIDATIANADEVANTLAKNKRNLAQTLCTLPTGVANYFQTSSWGEWFNVRIVEVILRDRENRVLADETELAQQRGKKSFPAFTDCGNDTYKSAGGRVKGGPPGAPIDQPSEKMQGLLRFMLTERADA
jgi:phospholipid/cholesterol/gamma-HCH transport system substrate-binding protein